MNTNTNTPAAPYDAVIACPHEISDKRIVLRFDPEQPGHNALNQLGRRMLAAAPAAGDMVAPVAQDERERFEAWAKSDSAGVSFEQDADGDYIDMSAALLWHGWQARAALPAQAVAPAQPVDTYYTRFLDLQEEVLAAKRVMLDAGCRPAVFADMFAEYGRRIAPQAVATVAPTEVADGAWHWVIYETLAGERNWAPAQRKRNHWNSTNFSGIPLCEVTVGPAITLAAPVQDVAPSDAREGWKLVPAEPTKEQLEKAQKHWAYSQSWETATDCYRAMIAAAPAAPQAVPSAESLAPTPQTIMRTSDQSIEMSFRSARETSAYLDSVYFQIAMRQATPTAHPAAQPADQITGHDLSTSDGGRGYVAEYFATRLRRHDFSRYITQHLAADFACALARHLDGQPQRPAIVSKAAAQPADAQPLTGDRLIQSLIDANKSADAQDATRYRLVRLGRHWSVIDGIGDTLRAEALDAAIDVARTQEGAAS